MFLFVCLMVFNSTFKFQQYFIYILVVSFIGGRNCFSADLSQVADKLYHIMLYTSPWSRFDLKTSVVIGTDCIGSCKSNYHTITAMMVPILHGDALYNKRKKNIRRILQNYHSPMSSSTEWSWFFYGICTFSFIYYALGLLQYSKSVWSNCLHIHKLYFNASKLY